MKELIALSFLLSSPPLFAPIDASDKTPLAKTLPQIPTDCTEQIERNVFYCSSTELEGTAVEVIFVGVVNKAQFPNVTSLMNHYLAFESWPDYAAASPATVVEYGPEGSSRLPSIEENSRTVLRQTYDYQLKVQGVPFLKHRVKGVTYHYDVNPYKGALVSSEFEAQVGTVPDYLGETLGLKSQVGTVHSLGCEGRDFCSDDQWLFILYTKVEPDISFAMTLVKDTIQAGLEDFLVGMFDPSQIPEPVE